MAIADDLSVSVSGDIRWTGGTATQYTVLELHRFLGDLADDQQASVAGDDFVDITSETPSDRSTDNIIELINGYNIDDNVAEHLYNGSITQAGGDVVYSGLVVVGSVETGTEIQIIQDDQVLRNYWGTGLNANAAQNIIHRGLVKTRVGGADIDGKRLRVRAAELGDTSAEFLLTAGLGNSTAALFTSQDLNNQSSEATIAGWTTIVQSQTGFTLLDVTGDAVNEEYLDEWDLGSQGINDLYERAKWIQQRSATEDSNADTGSDFTIGNGTITAQGQSFSVGTNAKRITRCRFNLKKTGTPTGTVVAELYAHSGTFGTSSVATGAALATSDAYDVSWLTTSYREIELVFNGNDALDQQVSMTGSTNYVIALRYTGGDVSNFIQVQGLATSGTHGGNRTQDTGSWAAAATDDLWFEVDAGFSIHGRAGESYRGITHEIVYDTESGAGFTEDEILVWGTDITFDGGSGTFDRGEYVTIGTNGAAGKVVYYSGAGATGNIIVALEDTSITIIDNDVITGLTSGATANVNTTILNNDKSGGEGLLLALDDNGTAGDVYIQLLTGSAPVDNLPIRGLSSATTAAVNVTVTSRTVASTFIGQSTGSAIIGAYGVGIQPADLTANDQLFDLTNTLRIPPNNVTFTVNGLVVSEDYVLVGPEDGAGGLDVDQLTLNTTLNGATETAVVVTAGIPGDTPTTGTIRVQLDNGVYRYQAYTGWTSSTFTIASTDYTGNNVATAPRNVFISYIDKLATATSESFTGVYQSDRTLFIRVRDGKATPIKTFETTGTLGNSGGSSNAIRTSDA